MGRFALSFPRLPEGPTRFQELFVGVGQPSGPRPLKYRRLCLLRPIPDVLILTTSRYKREVQKRSACTSQPDLQRLLLDIHDHAWEFKAERIAGMLSPTGETPSDILVNSAHEALGKKTSPNWPTVEMEGT